MKVLFTREGYAANSSSSHSIVTFVGDGRELYRSLKKSAYISYINDYYGDTFGWDYFSLTLPVAKLVYMLANILSGSTLENPRVFRLVSKILGNNEIASISDVKEHFSQFYFAQNDEHKKAALINILPQVDHNSLMLITLDNDLAENFLFTLTCEIVLNSKIIILGGNDNCVEPVELPQNVQPGDISSLWGFLTTYKTVIVDKKTGGDNGELEKYMLSRRFLLDDGSVFETQGGGIVTFNSSIPMDSKEAYNRIKFEELYPSDKFVEE